MDEAINDLSGNLSAVVITCIIIYFVIKALQMPSK